MQKILELYFKEKTKFDTGTFKNFKTLAYRSKFSILNINKARKNINSKLIIGKKT